MTYKVHKYTYTRTKLKQLLSKLESLKAKGDKLAAERVNEVKVAIEILSAVDYTVEYDSILDRYTVEKSVAGWRYVGLSNSLPKALENLNNAIKTKPS